MARHELTIKATYLPGWGIYEGTRELIQNARDAEVQFDAPMTVEFAMRQRNGEKTGAIVIRNQGTVLPKEALLIGHTTKEGDNRLIGKFGEGLKFGILALLRHGVEIKIRNGSEVWVPSIEHSEKYNAKVLVFNVTSGHKYVNRVQVEVVGITQADWDDIASKLLFIGDYPEDSVEVHGGHVLTSPKYRGQIFVKGMFVASTELTFGYDFDEADIDRDRRMVNDLGDKTASLLAQSVNQGQLQSQVYRLMQNGSDEVAYLSNWRLEESGRKAIADEFERENPGVIPVERVDQINELGSYGKKARQVPWGMRTILEGVLGTAAQHLQALRRSEKKRYEWFDLSQTERDTVRLSASLVARACQRLGEVVIELEKISIVDFHKDDRYGSYDTESGEIRLAREILGNKGKTLYVLVHEVAHTHGGDGVRGHEESIGRMMEVILNELL